MATPSKTMTRFLIEAYDEISDSARRLLREQDGNGVIFVFDLDQKVSRKQAKRAGWPGGGDLFVFAVPFDHPSLRHPNIQEALRVEPPAGLVRAWIYSGDQVGLFHVTTDDSRVIALIGEVRRVGAAETEAVH